MYWDLIKAILTTSDEFDKFIDELKKKKFVSPGSVEIIKASRTITSDDIAAACKNNYGYLQFIRRYRRN